MEAFYSTASSDSQAQVVTTWHEIYCLNARNLVRFIRFIFRTNTVFYKSECHSGTKQDTTRGNSPSSVSFWETFGVQSYDWEESNPELDLGSGSYIFCYGLIAKLFCIQLLIREYLQSVSRCSCNMYTISLYVAFCQVLDSGKWLCHMLDSAASIFV